MCRVHMDLVLAHVVYQPKSLIQSCFVHRCWHWHHAASASVLASVHTSPWHRVKHRNFIFGTQMHKCPQICTSNISWFWHVVFQWMTVILVFFFNLLFCRYRHSYRFHIANTYVSQSLLSYTKRNNTTVTYFLKFRTIFLKFMYSLLLTHVLWHSGH